MAYAFFEKRMIENKELGITEEDVLKETDIQILNSWRNSLQSQMTSILNRFDVTHHNELPVSAKRAYRYIKTLDRIIASRYGVLVTEMKVSNGYVSERAKRRNRTLIAKFMEVAKRELDKSEYKRILEIAQKELEQDNQ